MSSRPSTFDALMSNARNEVQVLNEQTSKSIPVENVKHANGSELGKSNPNLGSLEEMLAAKKRRVITDDETIAELRKKAASFDPKKAAFWGEGERVPYLFLAKVFDAIDKESGRIVITKIVCNVLKTVIQTNPDDFVAVIYLLANRIAPALEGMKLGIGDTTIIKALAEA